MLPLFHRGDFLARSALALLFLPIIGCTASPEVEAGSAAAAAEEEPGAVRGWQRLYTAAHVHTVHSHDACDGQPKPEGEPDTACVDDLRSGACRSGMDGIFLTDHDDSMADVAWSQLLQPLFREGDRYLGPADAPRGLEIRCPDGRSLIFMPGAENALMSLGQHRHPEAADLHGLYDGAGEETVEALQGTGATVVVSHAEKWETQEIAPLGVDGLEIYNLHANIDPRRGLGALGRAAVFLRADASAPDPDLALLGFFEESESVLAHWSRLAQDRKVVGVAGHDVHQNVGALQGPFRDGERLDSYRRILSWFSNVLLVREPGLEGMQEAVSKGRSYVGFDVVGRPQGFDAVIETVDGRVFELGEELPYEEGLVVRVQRPTLAGALPEEVRAPLLRVRLLRMLADGGVESVAESSGSLEHTLSVAGAYRVEVRITPLHVEARLGEAAGLAERELPWIYANPFYVR